MCASPGLYDIPYILVLFRKRGGNTQGINYLLEQSYFILTFYAKYKASVLPVKRVPPPFSNASIEAMVSALSVHAIVCYPPASVVQTGSRGGYEITKRLIPVYVFFIGKFVAVWIFLYRF